MFESANDASHDNGTTVNLQRLVGAPHREASRANETCAGRNKRLCASTPDSRSSRVTHSTVRSGTLRTASMCAPRSSRLTHVTVRSGTLRTASTCAPPHVRADSRTSQQTEAPRGQSFAMLHMLERGRNARLHPMRTQDRLQGVLNHALYQPLP